MRLFFSILLAISTILPLFAGGGWGDWQDITPGGNTINNYSGSGRTIFIHGGARLSGINEWYFYKTFVIGTYFKSEGEEKKIEQYFVVNEQNSTIQQFSTKDEWNKYLKDNNLNPKIWARWFSVGWSFTDLDLVGAIILFIPFSPFYFMMIYRAISRERFNVQQPYTIVTLVLTGIMLFTWLLYQYPQSI